MNDELIIIYYIRILKWVKLVSLRAHKFARSTCFSYLL